MLLHRYLTPTAILTDSEAEARAVEARLRARRPAAARHDRVDPQLRRHRPARRGREGGRGRGHPAQADRQHPRRDGAGRPRQAGAADRDPRRDRGRRNKAFQIRAEDVPDVLTRGLRERDGSVGRAILVYPNPASEWWRGETITSVRARAARGRAGARRAGRAAGARRGRAGAVGRHHRVDGARRPAGVGAGVRGRGADRAAAVPLGPGDAVRDRIADRRRAVAAGDQRVRRASRSTSSTSSPSRSRSASASTTRST